MTNVYLRTVILVGTFVVFFMLGYAISAQTGTEPGYFGAVETGAYGTTEAAGAVEGLSDAEAEYYKSLIEEE